MHKDKHIKKTYNSKQELFFLIQFAIGQYPTSQSRKHLFVVSPDLGKMIANESNEHSLLFANDWNIPVILSNKFRGMAGMLISCNHHGLDQKNVCRIEIS